MCLTSIHCSTQHGIRQHPQKQQRQAITAPDKYANSPGRFSMLVRILALQWGHTTSMDLEARTTPRVTTIGASDESGVGTVLAKQIKILIIVNNAQETFWF